MISVTHPPFAKILHSARYLECPGQQILSANWLEILILIVTAIIRSPRRLRRIIAQNAAVRLQADLNCVRIRPRTIVHRIGARIRTETAGKG